MFFRELSGEQRRQLIDTQQVFAAWRQADRDARRRFAGSMRWAKRNGKEYLLRKIANSEKSLGPRDSGTIAAHKAFLDGRAANRDLLNGLSARLDEMAPVNRAMQLGRLPVLAARILRQCDQRELLGRQLTVVGTNALYAYEVLAGVRFETGLLATGDIDFLYDARRRLSLATQAQLNEGGFAGLLRKVDKSFTLPRQGAFRAFNRDGYSVDLIRPMGRKILEAEEKPRSSGVEQDMEAAAIHGLTWLQNAPKTDSIVIDERGYPARITACDPRVYALHKAWMAKRSDRDPLKARRDEMQARAAGHIAANYLKLDFNDPELSALPLAMRALAGEVLEQANVLAPARTGMPDW